AFGAGYLAARSQRRAPVIEQTSAVKDTSRNRTYSSTTASASHPAAPVRVACNEEGLRRRIEDLEASVRACAARAAPASSDPEANRIPFPQNALPAETPDGFKKLIQEVVAKCNPDLELRDLDCSEYPCVAWMRLTNLERKNDLSWLDLRD